MSKSKSKKIIPVNDRFLYLNNKWVKSSFGNFAPFPIEWAVFALEDGNLVRITQIMRVGGAYWLKGTIIGDNYSRVVIPSSYPNAAPITLAAKDLLELARKNSFRLRGKNV